MKKEAEPKSSAFFYQSRTPMKQYTLPIIILLLLLASSCQPSDESQIRHNAQKYLDAMGDYDIDRAEPYATENTVNTTLVFSRNLLKTIDSSVMLQNMPAKTDILSIEIQNDSMALVKYHKTTPINNFDGLLEMRKEHKKWLASVTLRQAPPDTTAVQ